MSQKENAGWSHLQLMVLAALLLAASCVFHIRNARAGFPIYRDQHIGTALVYYKTHIDLLNPVVVGFNLNGTPTPQELPVWQAMVGAVFKVMGPWFGWGNVISLLVFMTCLFPLFNIAKMFVGERCAWWTLVFFLAQPLIFMYAGIASPDGFSIVAAIWFIYFGVNLLRNPGPLWWLGAATMGALAAVSKVPFFMAAGLTCFFVLTTKHRSSVRAWIYLGSAGAAAAACFLLWTHHTDKCNAVAEFPLVDLRVKNSEAAFWYFGDLHYRLVPGNWLKGGWRILNACFGSFALIGLMLYAFFFIRDTLFAKFIILAGFVTTVIFTHLVLHHSHYYLMFTPAFAILCAQTAAEWEKKLTLTPAWKSNLMFGIVAAMLGLSLVQGLIGMKIVTHFDPFPYDMAKVIDQYTAPSDKILVRNGGWGGNEFILSDRQGLSIWDTHFLENADTLKRFKSLGYTKLVMISDSPLITAVQQINPGEARLQRETYRQFMSSLEKSWPTIFESDDIVIKQIP